MSTQIIQLHVHQEEKSIFTTIEETRLLKMQIKAMEEKYKKLTDDIKNAIGEKEELVNQDGLVVATYKKTQVRRFDSKKLKADCEDIYNEYIVTSEQRTLLIK